MNDIIEKIAHMVGEIISRKYIAQIFNRLRSLGYFVQFGDSLSIAFAIQKVHSSITNMTNAKKIDKNLMSIFVDRVCGEFLYAKNQLGNLTQDMNLGEIDLSISQIKIGDTSVSYSTSNNIQSTEERIQTLIEYLKTQGGEEILCYRKIQW